MMADPQPTYMFKTPYGNKERPEGNMRWCLYPIGTVPLWKTMNVVTLLIIQWKINNFLAMESSSFNNTDNSTMGVGF